MKIGWLVVLGVVAVAMSADAALAWGPVTHVHLASQLLSEAGAIGVGMMALIARHAKHFLYGNIAADVVFGKRLSKVKHSCHKWSTAWDLLEAARTDEQQVFAYGYLTHLAADVVAHNKYVPWQLLMTRTTMNFGHIFWEMRADGHVESGCWPQLQETLLQPFPQHEVLLERHLENTLFSFETNLRIFNHMNLVASAARWRKLVGHWGRLSRWPLEPDLIGHYHAESLSLMRMALRQVDDPVLTRQDPSGAATLEQVRQNRRLLRRLSWQGLNGRWLAESMAEPYAPARRSSARRTSVA